MKASSYYSPEPIKLETFENIEAINARISDVKRKTFDNGDRLVLTLGDDDWSLVVNGTNYRVLKSAYGDETDEWLDKPIIVFKGEYHYRDEVQPGVCIRIPPQEETVNGKDVKPPVAPGELGDDDIPF